MRMEIVQIPISKLVPDPSNVRRHGPKNLEAIKGSLSRFGQQKPIVVTRDFVVAAGNGTLEAAKALGWESLNCLVTDLTGSQLTAFCLADNRTAELAEWDMEGLGTLLHSLREEDFDIFEIGFNDSSLVFTPDLPDHDEEKDEEKKEYKLVITLDDLAEQQELFLELRDRGFKVKV